MHTQPLYVALAYLALAACCAAWILSAPGCELARNLDRTIWGAAPGTDPQDPQSEDTNPPAAPPIVEIAAALLAAGGFGGMARWISKAKAAANGRCDKLQQELEALRSWADQHDHPKRPDTIG